MTARAASKRALDIVLAGPGSLLSAPLIALVALAIRIESPGGPIYRQTRVGKDGATFQIYKLRTMMHGAEFIGAGLAIQRGDARITRVGQVLRRFSLDELPNLWNVLRGEMSIVGPRPPLPGEVEDYDAFSMRRLSVKPGITCLWQISGRSNVSFEEWMRLDNAYIDTWSPLSDLAIVAKTIPAVISGEGAH